MGYKVYLTRYDDTYGEMLGSTNISDLERRALTIGYYGSVSRIAYSNHHNAVTNTSAKGFEILVANDINEENLAINKELYYKFLSYYNLPEERRIYSRDYNTGTIYDKTHNEIYPYTDYYAIIRIPHDLYNTYVTIYEPIYISNTKEFNWYWINKKYIEIFPFLVQSSLFASLHIFFSVSVIFFFRFATIGTV